MDVIYEEYLPCVGEHVYSFQYPRCVTVMKDPFLNGKKRIFLRKYLVRRKEKPFNVSAKLKRLRKSETYGCEFYENLPPPLTQPCNTDKENLMPVQTHQNAKPISDFDQLPKYTKRNCIKFEVHNKNYNTEKKLPLNVLSKIETNNSQTSSVLSREQQRNRSCEFPEIQDKALELSSKAESCIGNRDSLQAFEIFAWRNAADLFKNYCQNDDDEDETFLYESYELIYEEVKQTNMTRPIEKKHVKFQYFR